MKTTTNSLKINEPIGLVKGEWALYSKYGEIEIALIIENEYPKSFMVFNNANQQFANSFRKAS